MTKRTKTIALFSIVFTFLFCAIVGLLGLNFPTKVSAEYASPIPEGYYLDTSDYAVLDLTQTEISSGSEKVVDALGDAKVARFKFTNKSIKLWNFTICMFTTGNSFQSTDGDNYAGYYFSIPNATTKKIELSLVEKTGGAMANYDKMPFTLPDSLLINSFNTSYNIETGAIPVYNTSGDFAGTYIYLDANGMRVVEYFFQNANYHFAGYNSYLIATASSGSTTSINISEYDQSAINLDGKVTVKLAAEKCYLGETSPAVSQIIATVDGYGQIVEPKYYTVSYANTDKAGTATATVSFKGKYSGTATVNFEIVDLFDNNVLPEGYYVGDYTLLDLAKQEGNGSFSITHSGSEKNFFYSINGATAYTFKMQRVGNPWAVRFAIFNDATSDYMSPNRNSAYIALRNDQPFDVDPYKGGPNESLMQYPTWFDISKDNLYEFGGLKVYNSSNIYVGRLFYLDINGIRVAEYFHNDADIAKYSNDYLCINIVCGSTQNCTLNFTSPEATNVTGNTKVEVASSTNGSSVEITPLVYAVMSYEGAKYAQRVHKQYYDVAYVNNDKAGTATANITFKGKYAGTASIDYQIANVALTSDTDQTINILALDGATVDLGKIDVAGRAFVGYDVDGVLKTTHSIVAEENATVKYITVDFSTLTKASIKATGTKGMRFSSSIDTNDVARLAAYGTLSFGARITSPTRAGHLDIETTKWVKQNVAGEKDTYYSTITNFGDDDYNTAYMAQAYVDIAVDGGNTIRVYAYIEYEYSRTIVEVAIDTIASGYLTPDDPTYDYIYSLATYNDEQ